MNYKQVELQCGGAVMVAWIEEKYAHRGWRLSLEDRTGIWTVKQVFDTLLNFGNLTEIRKAQKEFASKLK